MGSLSVCWKEFEADDDEEADELAPLIGEQLATTCDLDTLSSWHSIDIVLNKFKIMLFWNDSICLSWSVWLLSSPLKSSIRDDPADDDDESSEMDPCLLVDDLFWFKNLMK